jgi:hypothetical protein
LLCCACRLAELSSRAIRRVKFLIIVPVGVKGAKKKPSDRVSKGGTLSCSKTIRKLIYHYLY